MIKIFSIACSRPDLILWQYKSFKDNITDLFSYTVLNNAIGKDYDAIAKICKEHKLKMVSVDEIIADPAKQYNIALNWLFAKINPKGRVMVVENGIFAFNKFNIKEYLGNNVIAGVTMGGGLGVNPSLFLLNIAKVVMPELHYASGKLGQPTFELTTPKIREMEYIDKDDEIIKLLGEKVSDYNVNYCVNIFAKSFLEYNGMELTQSHEEKTRWIIKVIEGK